MKIINHKNQNSRYVSPAVEILSMLKLGGCICGSPNGFENEGMAGEETSKIDWTL